MNIKNSFGKSLCLIIASFVFCNAAFSQDLSDKELKTNVSPIKGALQSIVSLEPKSFEYNTAQYQHLHLPTGARYGFIAEDFQHVFPALVYKKPVSFMAGKNSTRQATVKSIDVESLLPLLIASIQEQQEQINQLRIELDKLKK